MITVILMMNVMIIKQRMNNKNNKSTVCGNKNNNKQIFHAFLFNIRNYSPEVINIILLRVNNY